MTTFPTITTIQASDASKHTDKLQEILQNLKAEDRIDGFTTLRVENDLSTLTDIMEKGNFILIVLTREMESQREKVKDQLKTFKMANPGAGIVEIIVHNVPYENVFYTLPESLRPIRDQEDMDVAWSGIEQSLKDMFPPPPDPPVPPNVNLPDWLRGNLEWPWKSPGRWHGALFLGLPATVFVAFTLYIIIPRYFEYHLFNMILAIFFAGLSYGVAGVISRMRKISLFFAVAMAIGLMGLFIIFAGTDPDANIISVALLAPVIAIVGAWVGCSHTPFRLAGMILLGLWPWLFTAFPPIDIAFLFNSVIIAVVLCVLAWVKPIELQRAVKTGALPFVLNLTGGYLIYASFGASFFEGSALVLTIITIAAAASLGIVYRINRRRIGEDK